PTIRPYEEQRWAELPDALSAPVEASLPILDALHARWALLLDALAPDQWERRLIHPEQPDPIPLWTLVPHYAWHGRHHVAHITALRTRMGW
ncbi:MAG: DinB family protein, partial [Gemmatimonadetes bacterium]|nr:DinB family protein [Gemmatimonadota bacterium]